MISSLLQYFSDRGRVYTWIRFSCLVMLFVVILYLCGSDGPRNELRLYYSYSLQIVQGELPYRDFPVEYPPLFLVPMLIPQGLNFLTSYQFAGYEFFFYVQNILLVYAIGCLILKIAEIQQLPKTKLQIVLTYGLLIAVNAPFIVWRCDIFCAWLTVWATWLLLSDRPLGAGALLGLGIAAKLYPVLLLPIFAIHCLAQKKTLILIRLIAGCTIVLLFLFLLLIPLGLDNLSYFLTYQRMRGLQVEAFPSGLLILAHKLGWTHLNMMVNYGALHLESPAAKTILPCLPFVFAFGLMGTLVSYCNQIKNRFSTNRSLSSRQLTIYILAIITVFISTNKVFSPQYLLWLLPFIPLLPTRQVALFSVIGILTFLIYPVFYGFLIDEKILLVAMLNCRNYLIVVLAVRLIKRPPPRFKSKLAKVEVTQRIQT